MGVTGQTDRRPLWPFVPVELGPREHGGLGQVELMYRNSDLQALDAEVGGLDKLEAQLQADPIGATPTILHYGLRHLRTDEGSPRITREQVADLPNGWLQAEPVQEAMLAALSLAFGQDPEPAIAQQRAERARMARLSELVSAGHTPEQARAIVRKEQADGQAELQGTDAGPPVQAADEAAAG